MRGTYHGVGRVRDDGAEDSGDVSRQGNGVEQVDWGETSECDSPSGGRDSELLELVVRILGLSEGLVDLGDGGLERPELDERTDASQSTFATITNSSPSLPSS